MKNSGKTAKNSGKTAKNSGKTAKDSGKTAKDSGKIYSRSYGKSLIEVRNANGNLHSTHGLPSVVTGTHVLYHNDGSLSIVVKYSERRWIEGILERVGCASASSKAPRPLRTAAPCRRGLPNP